MIIGAFFRHEILIFQTLTRISRTAGVANTVIEASYLSSNCLVSQKATSGRVTEIICHLGKWGGAIMSERGGCERKSPTSRQAFYRELVKVGKGL